MDIPTFVVCSGVLLLSLKPAYQIWFSPDEYEKTLNRRRRSVKNLPTVFKKQGRMDRVFRKLASAFVLIICILGIIVSFTGPL